MESTIEKPQVFNMLKGEALEVRQSAYGNVGKLFGGEGIEVVWVKKQAEEIDRGWFSQAVVDLILVVQGELKVEFEKPDLDSRLLKPGDLMVLPANTRCRAYRWPREVEEATIFLAVYPQGRENERQQS